MRTLINSREYDIPTNSDGTIDADALRRAAGVPSNRALILKKTDGSNDIVNPGQKLQIQPGQHFSDMSLHRRGK
jgi:hypothetical protein